MDSLGQQGIVRDLKGFLMDLKGFSEASRSHSRTYMVPSEPQGSCMTLINP